MGRSAALAGGIFVLATGLILCTIGHSHLLPRSLKKLEEAMFEPVLWLDIATCFDNGCSGWTYLHGWVLQTLSVCVCTNSRLLGMVFGPKQV